MRWMNPILFSFAVLFLTGWGHWGPNVKIGLALDNAHDRQPFIQKLRTAMEENRAELLVKDAQGDPATQTAQVQELIHQGIQTLAIIPCAPSKASALVRTAHEAGIKVLSIERLIPNSDLDYLVDFNNEKAGELQAKTLVKKVPQGRYVLLGRDPAKSASQDLRKGQMKVLQPAIDRGDIQITASKWAATSQELKNILAPEKNKVDAILVADSETAEQVARILEKKGLSKKIVLAGIGEDLATCQRLTNGTQWMTVYHPPEKLAEETAYLAAKLARKATEFDCQFVAVDNGLRKTQAVLLTPLAVDVQNLRSTIVQDQVQKEGAVFKK